MRKILTWIENQTAADMPITMALTMPLSSRSGTQFCSSGILRLLWLSIFLKLYTRHALSTCVCWHKGIFCSFYIICTLFAKPSSILCLQLKCSLCLIQMQLCKSVWGTRSYASRQCRTCSVELCHISLLSDVLCGGQLPVCEDSLFWSGRKASCPAKLHKFQRIPKTTIHSPWQGASKHAIKLTTSYHQGFT